MALFGDSEPKIVCASPSVTVDLSSSSNKSFTIYNYAIPIYVLHTSPITGKRTLVYKGSYGGWKINIWNLAANNWNNIYKQLRGKAVTFYPHADVAAESVLAYVVDVFPYKKDNLTELDAVQMDIQSVDFYSPTEH